MMTIIFYITVGYLLFTSLVFLRNLFEFKGLVNLPSNNDKFIPKVSICIPARNEAPVIERCITSALKQDYENFEVLVFDDESTDGTKQIVQGLSGIIKNLILIEGSKKPEDWLGKPWACHQLGKAATGDILLFIDADVTLNEHVLQKSVEQLKQFDTITIWPQQQLESFWEKMVIPLIYFALWTLLPAIYVQQYPKWLPGSLKTKMSSKFAAACGQFLAFNRRVYEVIGGHEAVKDQVVEDVELAKKIKSMGFTLRMLHGAKSVYCRMYTSHSEIWSGLRKNFFTGFNKNVPLFGVMALVHLLVYVLPFIVLGVGIFKQNAELIIQSSILASIILIQRMTLSALFKWDMLYSLLHPFSVLWYQVLGIQCLIDYFIDKKAVWKGREV